MTGHDTSSIEIDVVHIDIDNGICGAVPIYLDVDGLPVVTVELFDLDIWATTVGRLARWLKAADAAIWDDYVGYVESYGGKANPALVMWVLETMDAQMRSLVETGPR